MLDGTFSCKHRKRAGNSIKRDPREQDEVFSSQKDVDDFVNTYPNKVSPKVHVCILLLLCKFAGNTVYTYTNNHAV